MTVHPQSAQRIPVNVLTGFLGSGKTTLLRRLLASPALADCAVLINELGEIGLDHQLLDHVDQETVLLKSGCICCSIRDDLRQALSDLHDRRERRAIPQFNRVIIETTGLADPLPVLNTVMTDPVLKHHFRLGNVITTVDAVNGFRQLQRQSESRRQAAVADRLVITKADLAHTGQLEALRDALQHINSCALLVVSHNDAGDAEVMLTQDIDKAAGIKEVRRWLQASPSAAANAPRLSAGTQSIAVSGAQHDSDISTVSLILDQPINWVAFGVWLSMLLHSRGDSILRVKGILNIQESALPVVVHGVQHLIHAPMHLSAWPNDDRRSRLVLIGNLPPARQLQDSLEAFNC